jgi:hypothetical protein
VRRGGPRVQLSTLHLRDDGSLGAVERTKTNPEGRLLTRPLYFPPRGGRLPPLGSSPAKSGPAVSGVAKADLPIPASSRARGLSPFDISGFDPPGQGG